MLLLASASMCDTNGISIGVQVHDHTVVCNFCQIILFGEITVWWEHTRIFLQCLRAKLKRVQL